MPYGRIRGSNTTRKMPKTTSLFPIPGSKRAKKYQAIFSNSMGNLVEPFMGGASTSIITRKPSILADTNPWHRGLAKAVSESPKDIVHQYQKALNRFTGGTGCNTFLAYSKVKQAQKVFKDEWPLTYARLTDQWREMGQDLYQGNPEDTLGLYLFMQRAAFGNVLRLNPTHTGLNVSWHVQKLIGALSFEPYTWARALEDWKPTVVNSYQEAIALAAPEDTHLLLDPPYFDPQNRMTPCYLGHVPSKVGTLELAIDSLELGLSKGFPVIHLCNYYSPDLEERVRELAAYYRRPFMAYPMGRCKALGNSNGRLTHGERVDHREKPEEIIYEFV